ncbi:MAG: MFS transporter [Myxococcota bacterium]
MVRTVGYVELFRDNRDFRNLFAGRIVSLFGDWFNLLAILAMLRAFGDVSATGFAVVLILKSLPGVLAPLGGVLADRLPRRNLMVAADLGRAWVVYAMLGLVFVPNVTLLYTLVVIQTLLSAVFEPARNALFPDLVRSEELTAANAVSAATWSLMLAVGAATGGLFTDLLGWELALLLDAVSYLVSAVFLMRIREPAVERAPRAPAKTLFEMLGLRDLWNGAVWMLQRPRVWSLALIKPTWSLTGARTLVLTLLGETAFQMAGWPFLSVAALYVARGIGTGVGPFVSRWLTQSEPRSMERAVLVSLGMCMVGYTLLGFAPSLPIAAALLIFAHLGGATIWVFSTIRLQQLTPSVVRGRVFSTEHAAFTFTLALSNGVFGQVGDQFGDALGAVLGPWIPWAEPAGLAARSLAIGLGLVTLLPLTMWALRGWWLGYGHSDDALDDARAA